jgi:glycosyltransferase involved in cell wall biosynthesis
LVIVEAMAAGRPFIAFPAGNIAELPGGIVVSGVEEMAARATELLNDPNARESLGAEGRAAHHSRYEWEAVVDQYEDLYSRLVQGTTRLENNQFHAPTEPNVIDGMSHESTTLG